MPPGFILFVSNYGYLALFISVFLQEIGVPNPITNEILLLFAGYLAFDHQLSLVGILVVTIAADIIGSALLYIVFYLLEGYIFKLNISWLKGIETRIHALGDRVEKGGWWGIFVGRHIPFVRGYVCVASGLFRIKPTVFFPVMIGAAITWTGGWVIAGRLLGKYWENIATRVGGVESIIFIVLVALAIIFTLKWLSKQQAKKISQPD